MQNKNFFGARIIPEGPATQNIAPGVWDIDDLYGGRTNDEWPRLPFRMFQTSGGVVSYYTNPEGSFKVHTFLSPGTLTVSHETVGAPAVGYEIEADVFVVGGGAPGTTGVYYGGSGQEGAFGVVYLVSATAGPAGSGGSGGKALSLSGQKLRRGQHVVAVGNALQDSALTVPYSSPISSSLGVSGPVGNSYRTGVVQRYAGSGGSGGANGQGGSAGTDGGGSGGNSGFLTTGIPVPGNTFGTTYVIVNNGGVGSPGTANTGGGGGGAGSWTERGSGFDGWVGAGSSNPQAGGRGGTGIVVVRFRTDTIDPTNLQ